MSIPTITPQQAKRQTQRTETLRRKFERKMKGRG